MTTDRVLVLDDGEGLLASSPGLQRMREVAEVHVTDRSLSGLSDAELADVTVLMAVRERSRLDAAALDRMPRLRLLLQTGGHAYHVDVGHATARGIPVALGRRGVGPRAAVPELTFALAVSALRHIVPAARSMAAGGWEPFLGRALAGRTLGILGFGRHGRSVARLARAFDMSVVVWERMGHDPVDDVRFLPLDELLRGSDVLSIHLRLSDESRGLLGARELAAMKPGSVLINTSRGAIVDEPALVDALQHGPLSAAGLDVFAVEPLPEDSPLRALPNVTLTPHIGWTVEEVFREFAEIAAQQLADYRAGTLAAAELANPQVVAAR